MPNKLVAVGLAGALTTIIVWLVQQFAKITIPAEVGMAISTVLSIGAGYFTPRSDTETRAIAHDAVVTGVYPQQTL